VLLLDELFREDGTLEPQEATRVLALVVGESGARFIRYATGDPSPETWAVTPEVERQALAQRSLDHFGNIEFQILEHPVASFAFDVTRCHFVSLCGELGKPHLTPLFCQADEVLFGDPRLEVNLHREQTLAEGHEACTFRLRWSAPPRDGEPLQPDDS